MNHAHPTTYGWKQKLLEREKPKWGTRRPGLPTTRLLKTTLSILPEWLQDWASHRLFSCSLHEQKFDPTISHYGIAEGRLPSSLSVVYSKIQAQELMKFWQKVQLNNAKYNSAVEMFGLILMHYKSRDMLNLDDNIVMEMQCVANNRGHSTIIEVTQLVFDIPVPTRRLFETWKSKGSTNKCPEWVTQ